MTNGIDRLTAMREERKAHIPKPRHAARATAVEVPDPPPQPAVEPAPDTAKAQVNKDAVAQLPQQPVTSGEKYSVYFDRLQDDFLEAVRVAGRHSSPKIDASRSAVARLAVTMLAEQMTPAQVLDELRARAPKQPKTGRRRY